MSEKPLFILNLEEVSTLFFCQKFREWSRHDKIESNGFTVGANGKNFFDIFNKKLNNLGIKVSARLSS